MVVVDANGCLDEKYDDNDDDDDDDGGGGDGGGGDGDVDSVGLDPRLRWSKCRSRVTTGTCVKWEGSPGNWKLKMRSSRYSKAPAKKVVGGLRKRQKREEGGGGGGGCSRVDCKELKRVKFNVQN